MLLVLSKNLQSIMAPVQEASVFTSLGVCGGKKYHASKQSRLLNNLLRVYNVQLMYKYECVKYVFGGGGLRQKEMN